MSQQINLDDFMVDSISAVAKQNLGVSDVGETNQIVDVPTLEETITDQVIEKIDDKNKKAKSKSQSKKSAETRRKNKKVDEAIQKLPDEEFVEKAQEIAQEYETGYGIEVPKEADIVDAEQVIAEAEQVIDVNPEDLVLEPIKKKSRAGYFKCKVNVGANVMPARVHKLSSYLKSSTKGGIVPRITDLRVIVHTNETQLRNSKVKLTAKSITYKPKQSFISTKKGTRVIISIPEQDNGEYIMYLSDGRRHVAWQIPKMNGVSEESYNQWIAARIADFFVKGIEVVALKVQLRKDPDPLMPLIDSILVSGDYKAIPQIARYGESIKIDAVRFFKPGSRNSGVAVDVTRDGIDKYSVTAYGEGLGEDENFFNLNLGIDGNKLKNTGSTFTFVVYTIGQLEEHLKKAMDVFFDADISKIAGFDDESLKENPERILRKYKNMGSKLTFKPLKIAYTEILKTVEDELENGALVELSIDDVLDKKQVAEIARKAVKTGSNIKSKMNGELIGEAIKGHTDYLTFTLIYCLTFMSEKDKRRSSSFITSEKYYYNKEMQSKSKGRAEHYTDVKDHRPAPERERSLAGRGQDRNYHGGDYLFHLTYTLKGKQCKITAKTFKEINDKTKFLTQNPQFV